VVGKYYVRGINENRYDEDDDAYNRTYTDAPALGCEIAPPGEIDIDINLDKAKFLDTNTPANNIISVVLKPDSENKNPYRTYTVQKLTTETKWDPDTEKSITTTEWKDLEEAVVFDSTNTATYTVTDVGSYRFYLYSKLNRADTDIYSNTCEFFNPPITLAGTMKINDNIATDSNFPYRYNSSTQTIVVGEKYDETTGEWVVDEELNNLGHSYTLYVLRDLSKEEPSSVGEVEYKWQYALVDNSSLIDITPDDINPTSSVLAGLYEATYADYVNPETGAPFTSEAEFDKIYPNMHSKLGKKL
jgi:hypothetical protein